jgi:non-ribosomal peptide synthetase component F
LLTKPATPLNLITDYPRCDEAGQHQFPSGNEWFQFPPELTQQLKQFSQHHEVTLFTTLLAAYVNLLHQLSGSEDLWIAAPMSKRNQASIENLIGFFSSMSLLHIQTTKGQAFTELLAHVKEVLLAALVNQDITLKQLLQASSLDWLPEIPQIRTMLNFTQRPLTEIAMQGLMARLDIKASSTMNNDLAITMWEENNSDNGTTITGYFSYRMDLFKSETILQIIKNFQQLLEANTRIFDGQLEMVHGTIKVNSDISGNAMSVCSG